MRAIDKIKAFFKYSKSEARGIERKAGESHEVKVGETPEKKGDESGSKQEERALSGETRVLGFFF